MSLKIIEKYPFHGAAPEILLSIYQKRPFPGPVSECIRKYLVHWLIDSHNLLLQTVFRRYLKNCTYDFLRTN